MTRQEIVAKDGQNSTEQTDAAVIRFETRGHQQLLEGERDGVRRNDVDVNRPTYCNRNLLAWLKSVRLANALCDDGLYRS